MFQLREEPQFTIPPIHSAFYIALKYENLKPPVTRQIFSLWIYLSLKPLHRTGNGGVFFDVPGNFVVFVVLLLYLPSHYM